MEPLWECCHNEMQTNTIRLFPFVRWQPVKTAAHSPKGIKLQAAIEKAKFLIICHPGGGRVMVCSRPGRKQSLLVLVLM